MKSKWPAMWLVLSSLLMLLAAVIKESDVVTAFLVALASIQVSIIAVASAVIHSKEN